MRDISVWWWSKLGNDITACTVTLLMLAHCLLDSAQSPWSEPDNAIALVPHLLSHFAILAHTSLVFVSLTAYPLVYYPVSLLFIPLYLNKNVCILYHNYIIYCF
jgi:hypothetical protein